MGETNTTSNNQTIPHNTAKMKFTPVAFAGLLALAKCQDVVDDIKSVGEDIFSIGEDIFSDVGNGFSDIVDNIHTEFDDIVAEVTGGAAASYWSDRLASVSAKYEDILESYSEIAATASGDAAARVTSLIGEASEAANDAASRVSDAIEDAQDDNNNDGGDGEDAGVMQVAALGFAGLAGGVAVFM